jgi:predicted transposase/invertase (TIGR01784 family)
MTDDERWAVLIEYANDDKFKTKAAEFESREEYNMAMKALNRISQDEIMQIYYLNREIAQMDYNTGMYEAEKRGLQQGIEQGLEQGLEQGKRQNQIDNARTMKLMGYPPADIEKITGVSVSDIQNL